MYVQITWKNKAAMDAWMLAHPGLPTTVPFGEPAYEFDDPPSGKVRTCTDWPVSDLDELLAANAGLPFEDGGLVIRRGGDWNELVYPWVEED
jgi:hypothetical protein